MKTIDELGFYTETKNGDRFVGRCQEFADIRSRPRASRLDALDDVIAKVAERIRDIDASRQKAAGR